MDRILIMLKKENGPRASSAPALGLNTIIFKHVYWYMQQTQVSVYRTIGPLVLIFAQNIDCGYSLEPPRCVPEFRILPYSVTSNLNCGVYLTDMVKQS